MDDHRLSDQEATRLSRLRAAWIANRAEGNFKAADAQRAELARAGLMQPDYLRWHPVFEEPSHRAERLKKINP